MRRPFLVALAVVVVALSLAKWWLGPALIGCLVAYVVGRRHWGRGIATAALGQLLALDQTRPMHADVAADNAGSLRVLTKHGFAVTGQRRDYAQARAAEIDVLHLSLSDAARAGR
jgi:RimJ/RimL family protein N-acetyltransferase